ncbi:MAG: hypothetical protein F6K26_14005 [Moorea sp. SIO2I5]|nr:hypothetical protein [Moorena sp. SIO2I5]
MTLPDHNNKRYNISYQHLKKLKKLNVFQLIYNNKNNLYFLLFPIPCSLFPTPYSLLPTPYSLFPTPYCLKK